RRRPRCAVGEADGPDQYRNGSWGADREKAPPPPPRGQSRPACARQPAAPRRGCWQRSGPRLHRSCGRESARRRDGSARHSDDGAAGMCPTPDGSWPCLGTAGAANGAGDDYGGRVRGGAHRGLFPRGAAGAEGSGGRRNDRSRCSIRAIIQMIRPLSRGQAWSACYLRRMRRLVLLCLMPGLLLVVHVREAQSQEPLGPLTFIVASGPSSACPSDASPGTWLKIHGGPSGGLAGVRCNGTLGNFSPGPLTILGGVPDAQGMAPLTLQSPVVIGVNLTGKTHGCGGACVACWRFEQDPSHQGWVACEGGANTDVTLFVDSHGAAPPPPPACSDLTVSSGSSNSGPGAGVVRTVVRRLRLNQTST